MSNKLLVGGILLSLLLGLGSAAIVMVSPTLTYNSLTNTLVVNVPPFNSLVQQYGQNTLFAFQNRTYFGVNGIATFNISQVSGTSFIQAPANTMSNTIAFCNITTSTRSSWFGNVVINNANYPCNVHISILPPIPLNIIVSATAPYTYSNNTFGIHFNITVAQQNINKTLGFGQVVTNSLYGYRYVAPSANNINATVLKSDFDNNFKNNCIQWVNVSTTNGTVPYCTLYPNMTAPSDYLMCTSQALYTGNLSRSLAQCNLKFVSEVNATKTSLIINNSVLRSQLNNSQNQTQYWKNQSNQKQTIIDDGEIQARSTAYLFDAVCAIVCALLIVIGYLFKLRKDDKLG